MDTPTTLYCKRAEAGRLIAVTGEEVGAAGMVTGPDAGEVRAATAVGAAVDVAVDVAVDATGRVNVGVTAAVDISGGNSSSGLDVNGASGAAEALAAAVEVAAVAIDSGAVCARLAWATGFFCTKPGAGAATAAGAGTGAGIRGAGASMLRVANVLPLASALSALLPGKPKRVGEACSTSTCANATNAAKSASGRQPGDHWAPAFAPGEAWP